MSGLEVCRECLVPLHLSSEHTWMNSDEGELNVTVTPLEFTFEKEATA